MAVLLPNRMLGVRRRSAGPTDAHGDVSAPSWGPIRGPWPGRAEESADAAEMGAVGGRTWVLALDAAAWPLLQGDRVVEPSSGTTWLVVTADLLNNNADASIDYVRVEGHVLLPGGTRP